MAACEHCWDRAYLIARTTGQHQVDVYHELVAEPCTKFPPGPSGQEQ